MKFLEDNGAVSSEMLSIIENTNDVMFIKNRDSVYIAASRSYAMNCVRCDGMGMTAACANIMHTCITVGRLAIVRI